MRVKQKKEVNEANMVCISFEMENLVMVLSDDDGMLKGAKE